jgi:hypothetical protein
VWELVWEELELPLCDCEAWASVDMEGPCPPADLPAIALVPVLQDLVSGARVEPLPRPEADTDGALDYADLTTHAAVTASAGPYLFFRHEEETSACGAAHGSWSSAFVVFDLQAGEPVSLLTAQERGEVLEHEQVAAFEQMRGDRLVAVSRPTDLELTAIEPALVPGLGLVFSYQFTAASSFADSDDNWGSYSRSITVPARRPPGSLVPYVSIPPALMTFAVPAEAPRVAGWIPVTGGEAQMAALMASFGTQRQAP